MPTEGISILNHRAFTKKAINISIDTTIFALLLLQLSCNAVSNKVQPVKDSIPLLILPAASALPATQVNRLRNACTTWYDSVFRPTGFNGGMLVARKGNIICERYHGTGHIPGTDSINVNTSLHIASTSKTFTAMAVLKLWQDGKLGLDDEFSKYFPPFNYPGVTIRSLLDHRSGLPNYLYFMETLGWDKTKMVTNEDVLNYLVTRKKEMKNISTPNIHFTYCNTNYALLALLIEKITGTKFAQYLNKIFFTPLQMKNTFVCIMTDTVKVNPSYDWRGRIIPFGFLDAVYGDKNIYTTPRDMMTWDRALNSGLIFSPATLQQAFTPYSNEKRGIRNYGLGWRMNIYPDGRKIIYHNGWWHGSNASFIRLLQDSVTIIVIGNKFNRKIYHAKSMAVIFDEYYYNGDDEDIENNKFPDSLNDTRSGTSLLHSIKRSTGKSLTGRVKKGKRESHQHRRR